MRAVEVSDLYQVWRKSGGRECTIIDVREGGEYAAGHIPGTQHIALNTIPACSDAFCQDGDIYVVCRSGGRSAQAIKFLMKNGHRSNLINVTGGTMAWIKSGYPVERGE
ncbi:MAG: rhodanese-like domain-containing protein [Mariprofundales bacterium]|nr:rhodanese-like domain-containing protein [Mariprofundales bacterium]